MHNLEKIYPVVSSFKPITPALPGPDLGSNILVGSLRCRFRPSDILDLLGAAPGRAKTPLLQYLLRERSEAGSLS